MGPRGDGIALYLCVVVEMLSASCDRLHRTKRTHTDESEENWGDQNEVCGLHQCQGPHCVILPRFCELLPLHGYKYTRDLSVFLQFHVKLII